MVQIPTSSILMESQGTDLSAIFNTKLSLLHYCCNRGLREIVIDLVNFGADVLCQTKDGLSPLHASSRKGNHQITELLIQKGANVNQQDKFGISALHIAMEWERILAAKILLQNNADITLKSLSGKTPIDLIKTKAKICFLHMTCANVFFAAAKAIIDSGIDDVDTPDWNGNSPLILCARNKGWKTLSESLLDMGADMRHQNNQGSSSLSVAIENDKAIAITIVNRCYNKGLLDLSNFGLTVINQSLCTIIKTIQPKILNLKNNNLKTIPFEFCELTKIEKIKVEGNPLDFLPPMIRSAPWSKLQTFLRMLSNKASQWTEKKLLFVGQEGVGKSTLLKCFKVRKGKTNVKENLATDGVEIHRDVTVSPLDIQAIASEAQVPVNSSSDLVFNCWDLGGQEIFYPTHQFFLTSNSFYILVFNLAEIGVSRIEYWMRQIKALSSNSSRAPIFMVGTHADDERLTPEQVEATLNDLSQKYRRQVFHGLQGIFPVSCKTSAGIAKLKAAIYNSAEEQKMVVPISWVNINFFLRGLDLDHVTWENYVAWAAEFGILREEVPLTTEFLMDNGTLIHFDDDQLHNIVILSPQWLADVMSSLINIRSNWAKDGILSTSIVSHVFERFPPAIHDTLLALLERFSIIFRCRGNDNILVPSLLPEKPTASLSVIWPSVLPPNFYQQGRKYDFPFLPVGFFSRVMVSILHVPEFDSKFYWRSGVLIASKKQIALLTFDQRQISFRIEVRTSVEEIYDITKGFFLRKIIDCINTLIDSYYNMQHSVRRFVSCPHCALKRLDNSEPYYFTYRECLEAVTSDQKFLFCHRITNPSRAVHLAWLAPDICFKDLFILPAEAITIDQQLGVGGFGVVYQGKLNHSIDVAIKELNPSKLGDDGKESRFLEFQQEAFITSSLNHKNLVRLFGVVVHPKPQMILELVPKGDLFNFIHPKSPSSKTRDVIKHSDFPWKLRLMIAFDVAKGMRYLHSRTPPITHRDLRSPNIFLSDTSLDEKVVHAKVADFGLSRTTASTLSEALATWQWLAPEILGASSGRGYDETSDIYSFGVCCWELATLQYPFEEFSSDPRFCPKGTFEHVLITNQIILGLRPSLPLPETKCPPGFLSLFTRCWDMDPSVRPQFDEICKVLSIMLGQEAEEQEDTEQLRIQFKETSVTSPRSPESEPGDTTTVPACSSQIFTCFHSEMMVSSKRSPTRATLKDQEFLIGCADGVVICLSKLDGTMKFCWKAHASTIVAIQTVYNFLWTAGEDGNICIWQRENPTSFKLLHEVNIYPDRRMVDLMCVVNVPNRTIPSVWLACSLVETPIRVVFADSYELEFLLNLKSPIRAIIQHQNSVFVGHGQSISRFDLNQKSFLLEWIAHDTEITALASFGNQLLLSGSKSGELSAWKVDSEVVRISSRSVHREKILNISCHEKYILSSAGNEILIWNPKTLEPCQEITVHTGNVSVLCSALTSVISSGFDRQICLWKAEDNPSSKMKKLKNLGMGVKLQKTLQLKLPEEPPRTCNSLVSPSLSVSSLSISQNQKNLSESNVSFVVTEESPPSPSPSSPPSPPSPPSSHPRTFSQSYSQSQPQPLTQSPIQPSIRNRRTTNALPSTLERFKKTK